MKQPFDYFYKRAFMGIHNCTPELATQVAQSCLEAQSVNGNISIWHNLAKVTNALDHCQCWPCSSAREQVAKENREKFWRETQGKDKNGS